MELKDVDGISARPLGRQVILKMIPKANMYKGLHLPDRMADKPNNGVVVRVGPRVSVVTIGEWVGFNWRQGTEIGDDLLVIDERALYCAFAEPWEVRMKVAVLAEIEELPSNFFSQIRIVDDELNMDGETVAKLEGCEAFILDMDCDLAFFLAGVAYASCIPTFYYTAWVGQPPSPDGYEIFYSAGDLIMKLTKRLRPVEGENAISGS